MKLPLTFLATVGALAAQTFAIESDRHAFGRLSLEAAAEHEFRLTNTGTEVLRVRNVELTPPLTLAKMKSVIQPGGQSAFLVRLGRPRDIGKFSGRVQVNFDNPGVPPAQFSVSAEVVEEIEFRPARAVFAATNRGVPREVAIEITNHEPAPLEIKLDNPAGNHYEARLVELTPGRQFRLVIRLTGEGKSGRQTEALRLWTSNPNHRIVPIAINTLLNERVYTFPPEADLGVIPTAKIKARPGLANAVQATLMVYQKGGTDFQIQAETNIPFLQLKAEKSTKFPDRWQIRATIQPEKLKDGPIEGAITIKTNDTEFPTLSVPVLGRVDGSW